MLPALSSSRSWRLPSHAGACRVASFLSSAPAAAAQADADPRPRRLGKIDVARRLERARE